MGSGQTELSKESLLAAMTAFKSTAVLRACVALEVFDVFAAGPLGSSAAARRLGVDPRGLAALLAAAAGTGLLVEASQCPDGEPGYDLAPGARELLVTTEPGYCGGITTVAASDLEWAALGDLATAVRKGEPVGDLLAPDLPYWSDFAAHTTFVTKAVAGVIADALAERTGPVRSVLDVGCGHAEFGLELAARHPQARLTAQDWPSVLEAARANADRRGMAGRTEFVPGDAFEVDLTGPHDVIIAGNLLCHFSPARAGALLDRLVAALAPGGALVVAGFTGNDLPAREGAHAALLGLLMVSATPGGQMYSTADYRRMLSDRGLTRSAVHTRPKLLPRVIVAERGEARPDGLR